MAFVQQVQNSTSGTGVGNIASGNLGAAVTAGNALVVVAGYFAAASRTITLSDTLGHTYTSVQTVYNATDDVGLEFFFVSNTGGGTNSVTATYGGGTVDFPCIFVAEYDTIATSSANGGSNAFNRQAGPGTGANAITTAASSPSNQPVWDIGFSFNWDGGAAPNAGTGYTGRTAGWTFGGTTSACARFQDQRRTATTSVANTFTAAGGTGTHIFYTSRLYLLEPAGGAATIYTRRPLDSPIFTSRILS